MFRKESKIRFNTRVLVVAFVLAITAGSCSANKIIFDKHSQLIDQPVFTTCQYSKHYRDFYWAWGCPAQIHEYGLNTENDGFWSPCKQQSCEWSLYLHKPSFIYVDVFLEGDGEVLVSVYPDLGLISKKPAPGPANICSGVIIVDLTTRFHMTMGQLVNITAIPGRRGYVLIDKITVCSYDSHCFHPATPANSFQCLKNVPEEPTEPSTGVTLPGESPEQQVTVSHHHHHHYQLDDSSSASTAEAPTIGIPETPGHIPSDGSNPADTATATKDKPPAATETDESTPSTLTKVLVIIFIFLYFLIAMAAAKMCK